MEDLLYLCVMSEYNVLKYHNYNIAELKTPKLSLYSDRYIGSSGSQSSISDFIENKTKSVGKLISLSMSQISFCKYLKPVKALLSSNFRPNLNLQLPKLSFNRLNLYQTYW
jgi:hypothetical protein